MNLILAIANIRLPFGLGKHLLIWLTANSTPLTVANNRDVFRKRRPNQWVAFLSMALCMALYTVFPQFTVALDSPANIVYVSNENSGDITLISTLTHEVIATIKVGTRPRGIRITSNGKFLYVATSGSPKCPPSISDADCAKLEVDKSLDGIVKVDLTTREVVGNLPGGSDPEQFDFGEDGTMLYVSNEDTGQLSVINAVTGTLLKSIAVGREPEGVKVSPDGALVYVTSESDNAISVIATADLNSSTGNGAQNELVGNIVVGNRPRDIIFSSDSLTAYISNEFGASISVIDVRSQAVSRTIQLAEGSLPMGLALSSDNQTLYVANGRARTVSKIQLATPTSPEDRITYVAEVGRRPWGIGLSADDRFLYTANGPSNDVTVIETAGMTVVTTIKAGGSPWGIVMGRDPGR